MHRCALVVAWGLASYALAADLTAEARAVLERRCLSCHGQKVKTGGLDLTTRASAIHGGSKGTALKPGLPDESLLLARVVTKQMPPGAPLPAAEVETLRRWIAAGAEWNDSLEQRRAGLDWWSLQPLTARAPPSPAGLPAAWARSPIDRWIYSRLRENGLEPSPPANRRTLIRRLSFDLIGLPPTPEEVNAFLRDDSPAAYERLVYRLLASPHYGERWARHWLDVARFSESEGFERDWLRDHAWTYRDYVIRSFNEDKPYDQFAKEQIAGDVLEPVTHESIVATGLLALGPFDAVGLTSAVPQERAAVREDQLEEMLGTVSQTFLGLTVNCARCHDHKFDPIPQRDYYRLKAVFAGVIQPTQGDDLRADGRALLTPAEVAARESQRQPLRRRITDLEASIGATYREARAKILGARGVQNPARPGPIARWTFDADARDDFNRLHLIADDAVHVTGRLRPAGDKKSVTLASSPLPADIREKTLEAWIHVRKLPESSATILRIRNRSGFRGAAYDGIQYVPGEKSAKKRWQNMSTVAFRTADLDAPAESAIEGDTIHIAMAYLADDTIRIYRNGALYGTYKPDVTLTAGKLQTYFKDDAVVELTGSKDLELEEASVYDRALTDEQVAASYAAGVTPLTPEDLAAAINREEQHRLQQLQHELADARTALKGIPEPSKAFAAAVETPELTHILLRGDVTKKGELVSPGAVSCLKGVPGDLGLQPDSPEADRRRKLAAWIANPANPLFSRVIVNRLWHHHFGAGLVENPNDFGYNGGQPSHPELLDWLAGELIRGGWSLKKLHAAMVLSQAYRQSSRLNQSAASQDAANRLLWRYAPRRLESETVRDAVLDVSGKLNRTMYGPSFRPFRIVKNPGSYHSYEPADSDDAEQQRRTAYRMSVNTGGDPMLESLDCPVPSVKTPKRNTTTTALQALSLMNNAFIGRNAKAFAARLSDEGADDAARITRAFQLALGREPTADELRTSHALVSKHGLETLCWGLFNASEFLYVQ